MSVSHLVIDYSSHNWKVKIFWKQPLHSFYKTLTLLCKGDWSCDLTWWNGWKILFGKVFRKLVSCRKTCLASQKASLLCSSSSVEWKDWINRRVFWFIGILHLPSFLSGNINIAESQFSFTEVYLVSNRLQIFFNSFFSRAIIIPFFWLRTKFIFAPFSRLSIVIMAWL